jgi:hypothetical protein
VAISKIGICNLALSHIGAGTISALTEVSAEAVQCSLHYDNALDFVLRDYPWNFATRRVTLALSSDTPPDEWGYAYSLPSDCLWARRVVVSNAATDPLFVIEINSTGDGKILLTNEVTAVLQYTARITETTLFDPMFSEAFSWKLASMIAFPLTKSAELWNACQTMYINMKSAAQRADANEGQAETPPDADWIEARGIASTDTSFVLRS